MVKLSENATAILREFSKNIEKSTKTLPITCPYCNGNNLDFKVHAYRDRKFLLIIDHFVTEAFGKLCRWKCPECDRTFTHYPDIIERYKRYTFQLYFLCHFFLESIDQSLRKTVKTDRNNNLAEGRSKRAYNINYLSDKDKGRSLSHSTIWRWILNIKLLKRLIRVLNTIGVSVFKGLPEIYPFKYRSEKRKHDLRAFEEFYNIFTRSGKFLLKNLYHRLCNNVVKIFF